jgi:hypothetical protein
MVLVAGKRVRKSFWMDPFFKKLGESVYEQWKKENFDLSRFPGIALKVLEKSNPSKNIDLQELIHEFLLRDEQPFQTSSGFGQPELIAYDNPKFYIQLLFWLDGTTDIHQHEFSGAFHVMEGSSIHSHYDFVNVRPVTPHFRLGDLKLKDVRILKTGSTVPITSGKSCIHSLFHLETPSVTVVIRTHTDPGTGPQFTYLPPHVALDPTHHDALTMRRKQLLDVLERTESPDYADIVAEMIAELDFERGFFILQNCISHLGNHGERERIWRLFEKKHGALASPLAPTFREIIRRDALTAMRSMIEDVEHRFFLALLLNVESREEILRMISMKHRGAPLATVNRWAGELLQVTDTGICLLDASLPEELALDPEDQPRVFLEALSHYLRGGKLPPKFEGLSKIEALSIVAILDKSSWKALRPRLPSARKKTRLSRS